MLNQAFARFKKVADKKKSVTALDLEALVSDEIRERRESYSLLRFGVEAGTDREPLARVAVRMPDESESTAESTGDGPVDAIFSAIQEAIGAECELRSYTVSAVTGGDDALGEVSVVLRAHGRLATGQGVATDILEASARAYVQGVLERARRRCRSRGRGGDRRCAADEAMTPGP